MRPSTIMPLIELLFYYPNGLTWKEMLGKKRIPNVIEKTVKEYNFPRQTLDRHLKKLLKLGIIEKLEEPKQAGIRGRPTGRYRIRAEYRQGLGLPSFKVPNMWKIDGQLYTGIMVRNAKVTAVKHFRGKKWKGLPKDSARA